MRDKVVQDQYLQVWVWDVEFPDPRSEMTDLDYSQLHVVPTGRGASTTTRGVSSPPVGQWVSCFPLHEEVEG